MTSATAEKMFDAMMSKTTGSDKPADKPSGRIGRLPIARKPIEKAEMPLGTRIVIAGKPKMGKSSACVDARSPLYLDFENRLQHIDVPRMSPVYTPEGVDLSGMEYPFDTILSKVERGKMLKFLIDWLNKMADIIREDAGQNYQTVNFDTVDTLTNLAIQAHAYDQRHANPYQKDYQEVYNQLLPVLGKFMRLPTDIVFQCHVEEMGIGADNKVWLSLTPKLREWITSHADMILYVYQPDKNGLNRFYCQTKEGWPSGDGTGKLPEDLPTTMNAIYECWRGGDPEQWQPLVERWKTENIPVAQPPKKKSRASE